MSPLKIAHPVASAAFVAGTLAASAATAQAPTPAEVKAIAADAYLYAYPMLYNYKTLFQQTARPFVPRVHRRLQSLPALLARLHPRRQGHRYAKQRHALFVGVARSARRAHGGPGAGVLADRYYVLQWFDLYTHNFAYIGARATGTEAGDYLFAGPGWNGVTPPGIKQVIRSETQLVGTLTRTAWSGSQDRDGLVAMQRQYRIRSLSEYTGSQAAGTRAGSTNSRPGTRHARIRSAPSTI